MSMRYIPLLLQLFLFFSCTHTMLHAAREEQFAALYVDGKEVDIVFLEMEGNTTYVPIEVLDAIPKLDVNETNNTITTPIGTVAYSALFPDGQEKEYIPLKRLDEVLRIRGKYFPKEIALGLWTPWNYLGNGKRVKKKADILPASNLFNGIRLDVSTEYFNKQFNTRTELELTGRLFDGITRVSALQNRDQNPYINELFWLKDEDRYRVLVGIQNTQPHYLLPYTEMTGVQATWSNFDMPDISDHTEPTLRPSLGPDNRIISGKGPEGGTVVLRINDKPVVAERIRLDGTYRMDISQQNLSSASLVELWIYERDPVGAPVRKINLSYMTTATLLEKGQVTLLGGVGEGYNAFDPLYRDRNHSVVGEFYTRYGLTDTITLEGGVMQDAQERQYALFATTASLGEHLQLHAALSVQEGLLASYATLDGHWKKDYLTARVRTEPEGYRGIDADTNEVYLDYVKWMSDTLSLGVNGRYYHNKDDDIAFLLPTARYTPVSTLSFTLMPNYEGDYRFTATYTPNTDLRINYIYEAEEHRLSVVDYLTDEWSLYFDGVNDLHDKERYEAGVNWRSEDRNDIYFEAAAVYSQGNIGYKAELRHNLLPGVYAKYQARYEPYLDQKDKSYYFVNLIADFAFIEGSFHPTKAPEIKRDLKGYIVGNVFINHTKKRIDTKDIQILVNGSPVKAGESAGRFFVDNLKEGIYTVELDPSSLPMEYSPVESSYNVKVSNGAVSKVDFYVDVFYGIAGKLHRKNVGKPVKIVLTSLKDGKAYTTYTDQFDYYRFDAVPPGTYTLSVADEKLQTVPRKVMVKDDFLFDQDLYMK
jgi:hypothetical protein